MHPENDFFAAGTELRLLDAAGLQKHETLHRLSLHEQKLVARKGSCSGTGSYLQQLPAVEPREQCGRAHEDNAFSSG
jgi:hypothetical protein